MNGGSASLFERETGGKGWHTIRKFENIGYERPTRELVSDRSGINIPRSRSGRVFTLSKEPDAHDQQEKNFARECAAFLNKKAYEDRFQKLILSAPPKSLGVIRKHLKRQVFDRVARLIDKDLINIPYTSLYKYIEETGYA
jgi:protein required for attachment to host cells